MNTPPPSALRDIGLHEQITAIDKQGNEGFYPIDKLDAHIRNVPHVAVSIFVFREQRLLLQRRADTKYHSAGLWANTVCSHPRWRETAQDCASRRLREELCFDTPLQEFGRIDYAARVGDLYENEDVHCFFGHYDTDDGEMEKFNELEVSAIEWLTVPEILAQIEERPESFTEWFKIYMSEHREMIISVLQ